MLSIGYIIISARLAGDIADKLLERLSSNPIRLCMFCLRLDDEFHVDELLWYFTVIKLQQDAETASILYELDAWEYYRQQASILATGDNRLQEIHIYSSITDVPCIVYCQNKKRFSREFTHSGVPFVSDIRYHLVLEKVKSAHIDVVAVDAASRVSKEEQLLIGTLGLDKKGDICLQGALSEIRMLITEETVIRSGIYCDSNTVIVRCVMEPYKESVRCLEIGHPPACVFMDLPDFFGGKLTNQETKALEDRMKLRGTVDSEQWIVISDIHLDNDAVLESFESLLKSM
ncbi:hypothetical protein X943_000555 [Babesia divergens]|uniref:Uncharacterized protein n=1 Tax=Babesia divergens TaxID=32595 RepID=A0AAD9GHK2_BABDI|nr:hypothetical protein X943_000555 [Babesia divergens]